MSSNTNRLIQHNNRQFSIFSRIYFAYRFLYISFILHCAEGNFKMNYSINDEIRHTFASKFKIKHDSKPNLIFSGDSCIFSDICVNILLSMVNSVCINTHTQISHSQFQLLYVLKVTIFSHSLFLSLSRRWFYVITITLVILFSQLSLTDSDLN